MNKYNNIKQSEQKNTSGQRRLRREQYEKFNRETEESMNYLDNLFEDAEKKNPQLVKNPWTN